MIEMRTTLINHHSLPRKTMSLHSFIATSLSINRISPIKLKSNIFNLQKEEDSLIKINRIKGESTLKLHAPS